MRTIRKGPEPASLRKHRRSGGRYETYTDRDEARNALLREQGHICCYCMQRITRRAMKIEHWASQADHPDRTVDWNNLLGACPGGDGGPAALQHCDTARGSTALHVNPLDGARRCERLFRYLADGEMVSDELDAQKDVETLKLNNDFLKLGRAQVIDMLKSRLKREELGYWPRPLLEAELAAWQRRDAEGMYRDYCQVAVYILEKWLKRKQ